MKHVRRVAWLCALLVQLSFGASKPAPAWKVELPHKLDAIRFLSDSRKLLVGYGSTVWLHDAATGTKVWEKKFEDREDKGVKLFPQGDRFLISPTNHTLGCYSAVTGEKLWEIPVEKVSQNDYSRADSVSENITRISYQDWRVQVDLAAGRVLWSGRINAKVKEKGGYVVYDLPKIQKTILLMDDEKLGIFDNRGGDASVFEYEPPYDLIAKEHRWIEISPDGRMVVVMFDGGMAVIDAVNVKEIYRRAMEIDQSRPGLFQTRSGFAVFGKDRMVHYSFADGKATELPVEFANLRSFQQYSIGGKDLLLLSMENQLVCLDLANGKEQWRSKEGDPSFAGFVHRYRSTDGKLMVEGNRIVTTYVESQSSGDNKGTHLYVMGIDGLTGAVAFKVHAALAERALSSGGGLFSVLGKITAAAMTFGISAAADLLSPDIGFSNIGFDYGLVQEDGIVRVYVVTPAEMLNPDTRAEHGEGVCAVDIRSGKKLYGEYFAIAEGIKPEYLPLGLVSDGNNQVYFAGKKRVVGFNLSTGKRLWTLEEGLDGQPFDLGLVDGSLYVKLGKTLYSNSYREPRGGFWNTLAGTSQSEKFEINKEWSVDPFGIAAIDPANGKLLWCFEMDNDPSLAVGSLEDAGGGVIEKHLDFAEYYDQVNRVFYVSDLKNVFSLKAGPGGGKPVWTYSLSRNDLGTINIEKAYAIVQRHPMEFSQALRLSYSNNALIVFGPSGIAKINTAAGTTLWRNEWDFAWDDMQYYDQLPSEVLYCNKGTLERFDCRAGQVVWKMDVDKKSYFQTVRDRSMLIVWLGDEVYGLDLK